MRTITVAVLDRLEREVFGRVVPSLTIAYPDELQAEEDPRAVRALASGTDATYEIISRAILALEKQVEITDRQRHIDYWTHYLVTPEYKAKGKIITPATPGDGLVVNPYEACRVLATARETQWREAIEALTLARKIRAYTTPRPNLKLENV